MSRRQDPVEDTFRRWVKLASDGRREFSDMVGIQETNEAMPDEAKQEEALRMRVARIAASTERVRKPQAAIEPKRGGRPPGSKNKAKASPASEGGGGAVEIQVA